QELQKNDVIKAVRFKKDGRWEELAPDQWAYFFANLNFYTLEVPEVTLKVARGHATPDPEPTVTLQRDPTWPIAERGLAFTADTRLRVAANLGDAVVMGLQDTWSSILEVYQHLRGMVSTRISWKSVGGPLTIGVFAYRFANKGFWDLLFFI